MDYFKGIGRIDPDSFDLALGRYKPKAPEAPVNDPGFISDIRRGAGQFVSGVGSTLRDVGFEGVGTGIEQYGQEVIQANPSQIQSFEDVKARPFTTAREAVGELVPQVGLTTAGAVLGGRVVGGVLGVPFGPAGVAVGQTLGGIVGGLLPIGAQTYGGIRQEQRAQGIDDKDLALAVTIPITLLERLGGAERVADLVLSKGTRELAREAGKSYGANIAKQGLRGGVEETFTELPQTGLERIGAYKPLTGDEAEDEYAVAGAKAFLGGGAVRGAFASAAGTRAPEAAPEPTVTVFPDGTIVDTAALESRAQNPDQEVDLTAPPAGTRRVSPLPDSAFTPAPAAGAAFGEQGTLFGQGGQAAPARDGEQIDLFETPQDSTGTSVLEAQARVYDQQAAQLEATGDGRTPIPEAVQLRNIAADLRSRIPTSQEGSQEESGPAVLEAQARVYDQQAEQIEATGDGETPIPEAVRLRSIAADLRSRIPTTQQAQGDLFEAQPAEFGTRLTADLLKGSGLTPRSSYYRQLLGKDMADPAQQQSIGVLFQRLLDDPNIAQSTKDAISNLQMQAFGGLAQQQEMIGARGGVKPAGQPSTQQQAAPETIQARNTLPTAPMGKVAPDVADIAAQEAAVEAPAVDTTQVEATPVEQDARVQELLANPEALQPAERRQLKQAEAMLGLAQTDGERAAIFAIQKRIADAASARVETPDQGAPAPAAAVAVTPGEETPGGFFTQKADTEAEATTEADTEADTEAPALTDAEAAKEDADVKAILSALEKDADETGTKVLRAATKSDKKEAPGRPSFPAQVYAAIRNKIIKPASKLVIRQEGKAEIDKEATAKYGEKANRIANAARAFANAYNAYTSYNMVRSQAKDADTDVEIDEDTAVGTGEVLKRGSEEATITARTAELERLATKVRVALRQLGEAVDGNAKDVEAVVRFVKDRAQKQGTTPVETQKADIRLSSAWAAAKRETFTETPDLLDVNSGDTRQSREATARGADPQLVLAAQDGFATFGSGKKEKGVNGVLNYIRTVGTPYEKMLARLIKIAMKGNPKIVFEAGKAEYDPQSHTMTMDPESSKEVVLHEMLHAALQHFVYSNPTSVEVKSLINAVKRVISYDSAALSPKAVEVQDLLKKLMTENKPLDAVLELVSYGNTLNEFRKALTKMDADTPRTFVKFANDVFRIVEGFIARVLGVKRSVANDVLENTIRLLDQAAASPDMQANKGGVLNRLDTATSAFKRWFGSSKVVGKDGEPLVVYHGTDADITEFSQAFGKASPGFYFSSSTDLANIYASKGDPNGLLKRSGGNVMPVYLSIKNPFVPTGGIEANTLPKKLVVSILRKLPGIKKELALLEKVKDYVALSKEQIDALKERGYDGIITDKVYIAFEPTQIKSVFNEGTYSPENANILKAEVKTESGKNTMTVVSGKPTFTLNFTRLAFEAAGFGEGGKVDQNIRRATELAVDFIKKNLPGVEIALRYINSHFGFVPGLQALGDKFKQESQTSLQVATDFLKYLYVNPQDAQKAFAYLDGDQNALTNEGNDVRLRMNADILKANIDRYIKGLSSADRILLQNMKFSERLLLPEKTSDIASKAFGVDKVSKSIVKETRVEESIDIFRQYLDFKDGVLDSDQVLYQLMEALPQPDGTTKRVPYGFISKSLANQHPELDIDRSRNWHLDKSTRENANKFTFVAKAIPSISIAKLAGDLQNKDIDPDTKEAALETMTAALLNTVAALSKNYAVKNYINSLSTFGDMDGKKTASSVVFDTVEEASEAMGIPFSEKQVIDASSPEIKNSDIARMTMRSDRLVRLPAKGFGELSGKLISAPVWSNMQDMNDRSPLFNSRLLSEPMTWFKKAKTVYTPSTHANNILTNYSMLLLHGIPTSTLGSAGKIMYKYYKNPGALTAQERTAMEGFLKSGAILGQYTNAEAKAFIADKFIKSMEGNNDGSILSKLASLARFEKEFAKVTTAAAAVARTAKIFDAKSTELYAAGDNVFRLAAYLNTLQVLQDKNGGKYTEDIGQQAGLAARKMFLDYDIDAKAIRAARQSVLPFISWTYAILPVLGRLAITRPWAMANMLMAIGLMNSLGGDEDDEWRKMGPEQVREKSLFGLGPHNFVRLPFMGDDENPVYWNIGKSVPMMSVFDPVAGKSAIFGQSWVPSSLNPGGPYVGLTAAILFGIDPFTGKKLSDATDDNFDAAINRMAGALNNMTPSLLQISGINKAEGMRLKIYGETADYLKGIKGPTGDAKDALNIARFFGLSMYQYNKQETQFYNSQAAKKIKREFMTEINAYKREAAKRGYDDYEEMNKRLADLKKRMYEEMRKAQGVE